MPNRMPSWCASRRAPAGAGLQNLMTLAAPVMACMISRALEIGADLHVRAYLEKIKAGPADKDPVSLRDEFCQHLKRIGILCRKAHGIADEHNRAARAGQGQGRIQEPVDQHLAEYPGWSRYNRRRKGRRSHRCRHFLWFRTGNIPRRRGACVPDCLSDNHPESFGSSLRPRGIRGLSARRITLSRAFSESTSTMISSRAGLVNRFPCEHNRLGAGKPAGIYFFCFHDVFPFLCSVEHFNKCADARAELAFVAGE